MSKIKKADLLQLVQEQADMMVELSGMVKMNKLSIIKLENEREKPQLKQLEVDLSSELTGSELCKAMLARGDKYVMCGVSDVDDSDAADHESDDFLAEAVTDFDCKDELFGTTSMRWNYAVPINNQGEPLTASEVGF